MMEMGMDLVSDIPLPIDNETIGEHPPSQKLCHLLVILDSIYILRASQWSLQIINKTLCRNGFSSCEPRKAAAKQMTRRNKIFISCFSGINGESQQKLEGMGHIILPKTASGGNSEPSCLQSCEYQKYQCIQALTIPRQKVSIELSRVAEGKQ